MFSNALRPPALLLRSPRVVSGARRVAPLSPRAVATRPTEDPSKEKQERMASDWNRASGEGLCTVREVISFWFDERACFEDGAAHLLWDASWMNGKARTQWYAGTSADASCAKFAATIEATARGDLNAHEDWLKWPHGPMAKIILWDQIARNCFRWTAKAFEFDDKALELARTMARDDDLVEKLPPAYVHFVCSPFTHSERIEDHDLGFHVYEGLAKRCPEVAGFAEGAMKSHRDVIARFGRYPHRNAKQGRESTAEELAWLASDEVPGWAKSQ